MRKGYPVDVGYMGYIEEEQDYQLYDTEGEYNELYYDRQKETAET